MLTIIELLFGFLKVGCFAFGGAYAAIPLIRDVVLSYGWLTDELLQEIIAVSESTPGPIMVNLATYVGSRVGGAAGAAVATTAVVLPAFLIIILLLAVFKRLIEKGWVQAILSGLKPCVIGIILAVGVYMTLRNCFPGLWGGLHFGTLDVRAAAITAGLGALAIGWRLIAKKPFSHILLIVTAAAVGLAVYGI